MPLITCELLGLPTTVAPSTTTVTEGVPPGVVVTVDVTLLIACITAVPNAGVELRLLDQAPQPAPLLPRQTPTLSTPRSHASCSGAQCWAGLAG